ncbi:hypothetical protein JCM18899A_11810 [Nocardioides sp. AN3]
MIFDHIEWDEANLDHATRRLTQAEIEQAIVNASRMRQHPSYPDRGRIESVTDGGKRVVLIVQVVPDGVRPITGWEV